MNNFPSAIPADGYSKAEADDLFLTSENIGQSITAEDIGALPSGKDLRSLRLAESGVSLTLTDTTDETTNAALIIQRRRTRQSGWTLAVTGSEGETTSLTLEADEVRASGELYAQTDKRVYHENNKPSATDVGALPESWRPEVQDIQGSLDFGCI